jgi:anaerobic nitric oxide reductase transcription regulator
LSAADLDLPREVVDNSVEAGVGVVAEMPLITGDLRSATEQYQRRLISAALERNQDNWASAARELGLDRANLGRMAKRLGMKS